MSLELKGKYIVRGNEIKFEVTKFRALKKEDLHPDYFKMSTHCFEEALNIYPNQAAYQEIPALILSTSKEPEKKKFRLFGKREQNRAWALYVGAILSLNELNEVVKALDKAGKNLRNLRKRHQSMLAAYKKGIPAQRKFKF